MKIEGRVVINAALFLRMAPTGRKTAASGGSILQRRMWRFLISPPGRPSRL